MLIKCKECELQVSDKAQMCPHCGYPMRSNSRKRTRQNNKRRRLPNGFGQISEIKGQHLRKPYRAMVTVGKTESGRPICKMLKPEAFFATYNEAYEALVDYNRNPYDLDASICVSELYEKWTEQYFKELTSETGKRTIEAAWAYCSSIYNMRVKDVRARHLKGCMEEGYRIEYRGKNKGNKVYATSGIKSRMKSVFNLMFDYAVEYELTDRNYARTFHISKDIIEDIGTTRRTHMTFAETEMRLLWDNVDKIKYVDLLLIQAYSGWRPQEMGLIKLENVHLDEDWCLGGMKTKAGSDRVVPIHPKIKHLVSAKYKEAVTLGSEFLINCTDGKTHQNTHKMTYDKYAYRFKSIIEQLQLNPEHKPHDPRKHFVTMAKNAGMDEFAIKYIVGHSIVDLTEAVYTERSRDWLIDEMKKIK